MAKKVYTLGLASIEVGEIAADGGMGTKLQSLGYTYQDTAQMVTNDPTTTDFYAEEVDDPVVSISRAGSVQFKWSLMNPSVEVLQTLMGGTVTKTGDGGGENNTWEAPDVAPTIEKSVKITPLQGLKFDIPRLRITAKLNGNFSKTSMVLVEVTGTVMKPDKEGIKKLSVSLV